MGTLRPVWSRVYFQVRIGCGKPEMGYADDVLYERRGEHLKLMPQVPAS
jgi:hypothetical protein